MYSYPSFRQPQSMGGAAQTQTMFPLPAIGTTLPTGKPAGTYMTPMPSAVNQAVPPGTSIEPQTLQDTSFLPGFLKTQIGKVMRVQFLVGTTGPLVDRIGTLLGVGANYILMKPQESDDLLTADLYSIKFVDIYR